MRISHLVAVSRSVAIIKSEGSGSPLGGLREDAVTAGSGSQESPDRKRELHLSQYSSYGTSASDQQQKRLFR